MKGRPNGYEWSVRDKEVVITHHGLETIVLRVPRAHQFVKEVERGDPQLLMARMCDGTYKAPAERTIKKKPTRRR